MGNSIKELRLRQDDFRKVRGGLKKVLTTQVINTETKSTVEIANSEVEFPVKLPDGNSYSLFFDEDIFSEGLKSMVKDQFERNADKINYLLDGLQTP